MGDIRDAAAAAYPDGPSSNPTQPLKSQIRSLFGVVEDNVVAAASGEKAFGTWVELEAQTGTSNGQRGYVTDDDGTHVDDILSAVVENNGEYSWNATVGGWTRIGDLQASKDEVDAIASAATELRGNPLTSVRATLTPYRDAIDDQAAAVAQAVNQEGNSVARSVEVAIPSARDDLQPMFPIAQGLGDRLLIGVNAKGKTYLAGLATEASIYLPAETMRGGYDCFNVRPYGERLAIAATFQDPDGYIYDAMQIRSVVTTTAIAIERGNIDLHMVVGQSWAGNGSGSPGTLLYPDNPYSHHLLQIGDYASDYGSTNDTFYGLDKDLQAFSEPTDYGQSPINMALQSLIRFDRDAGRRVPPRVAYTSWEGNQPLASFFPATSGHYNHENAVRALQAAQALANPYLRALRLASVSMIQGQNGPTPYATTFGTWIDTVLPLYAAAIGQAAAPPFLYFQTNLASNVSVADGTPLDQVSVARARTSPAVSLVGPTYQFPLWDVIHPTDIGRMMMGDVHAIVLDRVVRQGLSWNPLWPVSGGVTRASNVITIPLTLPPGSTELGLDDDWVQSVTNRGFKFSQTGGNSPVIQSVVISGTSIVITLDVAPTGTAMKISYARDNDTGITGWSTGRGQVYARTSQLSAWRRMGYVVPEFVRHYCVAFEETFS